MKALFQNPFLYKALAILVLVIGLILTFIASGFSETYFPGEMGQKVLHISLTLIPTLVLVGLLFWIANRLKQRRSHD